VLRFLTEHRKGKLLAGYKAEDIEPDLR